MESTGPAHARHVARVSRPATPTVEALQLEADADEHDTEDRYKRQRAFAELIADAVRRAEALTRLERALSLQPH